MKENEPLEDEFKTGDLIWTIGINSPYMQYTSFSALLIDAETRMLLFDSKKKKWKNRFYKTEQEAKDAVDAKRKSMHMSAKDIVSVQPMTIPKGNIFHLEYEYKYNEDD